MNNITIQKLNLKDIEAAKQLLEISASENFRRNGLKNKTEILSRVTEKIKIVNAFFENNPICTAMYGAKINNKLVGLIAYGSQSSKVVEHIEDNYIDAVEIKSLFILPEYQKQGLGMKMFNFVCSELLKNKHSHFMLYSSYKTGQDYWHKILGNPYKTVNDKDITRKIWIQEIKLF